MTDNIPTIRKTEELVFYQTEDSLTQVEGHFFKMLEETPKASNAKLSKKRNGDR